MNYALRFKLRLAVKMVMVNPDSSFVQPDHMGESSKFPKLLNFRNSIL